MRRVRELISLVQQAYPHDGFFENIESTWAASAQARAQYAAYNQALYTMDEISWGEMKRKALAHYLDHRPGQLKQGFFNQLNEAFAYRHLVRRGYSGVRVLREDGKTKPDLEYVADEGRSFCEVKTVGISQEQLARWDAAQAFSSSVYAELSEGIHEETQDYSQRGVEADHEARRIWACVPDRILR